MALQLTAPFKISARLLPALKIGKSWLSFDNDGKPQTAVFNYFFWLDTPDGEHKLGGFSSPLSGHYRGADPFLKECFKAALSFLSAAAEARQHFTRTGRKSDNHDLFNDAVCEWAVEHSDELALLALELESEETCPPINSKP
jgi:hypothetical protein